MKSKYGKKVIEVLHLQNDNERLAYLKNIIFGYFEKDVERTDKNVFNKIRLMNSDSDDNPYKADDSHKWKI